MSRVYRNAPPMEPVHLHPIKAKQSKAKRIPKPPNHNLACDTEPSFSEPSQTKEIYTRKPSSRYVYICALNTNRKEEDERSYENDTSERNSIKQDPHKSSPP
jgi:hypothetical protein